MGLADRLGVRPGVTAVIGSGGKTTLLAQLARELPHERGARVILATSTRIRPFEGIPTCERLNELSLSSGYRVACVGTPAEEGKLKAPEQDFRELAGMADYVLVEADGARGLPLKAHASWEPVIPPGTRDVILVVGAAGLGRPVAQVVHRAELFSQLAGCTPEDLATPDMVARVIATECLESQITEGLGSRILVTGMAHPQARELAALLGRRAGLPVTLW